MWQYYQTLHGPNPGGGEHRTEVLTQTGGNPFFSGRLAACACPPPLGEFMARMLLPVGGWSGPLT